MEMRTLAVTAGLGMAAGMVAVLMMPKTNTTRKDRHDKQAVYS